MKSITTTGRYSNGKIYLDIVERFSEFEGQIVDVQIYKKNNRRSNQHNSYYWVYVIPLIRQGLKDLGTKLSLSETDIWLKDFMMSITKEQTHQFLKDRFAINEIIDTNTGEITKINSSTKRLDSQEFNDYIRDVIQFANETLNITIET